MPVVDAEDTYTPAPNENIESIIRKLGEMSMACGGKPVSAEFEGQTQVVCLSPIVLKVIEPTAPTVKMKNRTLLLMT